MNKRFAVSSGADAVISTAAAQQITATPARKRRIRTLNGAPPREIIFSQFVLPFPRFLPCTVINLLSRQCDLKHGAHVPASFRHVAHDSRYQFRPEGGFLFPGELVAAVDVGQALDDLGEQPVEALA